MALFPRLFRRSPSVVAIGGGTGASYLRGLSYSGVGHGGPLYGQGRNVIGIIHPDRFICHNLTGLAIG